MRWIVLLLGLVACGDKDTGETAEVYPDDLDMQAEDFGCITDMTKVGRYFLDNRLGQQAEAEAVASDPEGGVFPPGTILQLIAGEAMVKRAEGWNPDTNDWEFFSLQPSASGTVIAARGGAEVENFLGGSCFDCHSQAAPQWDFVCGVDHGCEPLGVSDDDIAVLQSNDPRCP